MVKGKKYKIVYSEFSGPFHVFNISVYKPSIEPIVKALFKDEIERAKARVKTNLDGTYTYIPSNEYIKAFKKVCRKPIRNRIK